MLLDRSKAPSIHENLHINIPETFSYKLDNGIEVYEVSMGTQNILKLEFVFNAGRIYESKKLVGRTTASLLKEATKSYSSTDLDERIDFYGASLVSNSTMDGSSLMMMCLTKHFEKLLPLFCSIWLEPLFPEDELEKYRKKVNQQLKINLAKNEIIAYREYTSKLFGNDHPYGYNSSEKTYEDISREDLLSHYERHYFKKDSKLFISGKIDESHRTMLNQTIGKVSLHSEITGPNLPDIQNYKAEKVKIKGKQEYQTAIRIGKRLFNRSNPDYSAFYFMNIILGGYFGSRLMKNIREEKAYTYGIHSYIDTLRHDGYFSISTEVGNEYLDDTLKEIYREIEMIKNELVSEHEFTMARNYVLGQFLNMLDGPLRVSQIMKTLVLNGYDLGFVEKMIEGIKSTTKSQLRDMAIKHLPEQDLWEVTVGNQYE